MTRVPIVEVSLSIAVPAPDAWSAIVDVEAYPDCMDVVRSVEILDDSGGDRRRTAWSVLLRGSRLEWIEREHLDERRRVISFEQETGDLETFSGQWSVRPVTDGRSEVSLRVEFDIGVPLLAEMLNPVAATALEDSARAMLLSLERRMLDDLAAAAGR